MTFNLRSYQEECVNIIIERFEAIQSQLVQLPTGAGKTVILWHVLKFLGLRSLIVAPTRELTEQIEETGMSVVPPKTVYLKKKSYWPKDTRHLIMTGQAATFSLNKKCFDDLDIDILIIDEAHRSRANNLERLIGYFKDRGAKILGLTATPERLDRRSLLDVFEELTFSCTLLDLIREKHLVDIKCFKIETKHSIDESNIRFGDLTIKSVSKLNVGSRNDIILDVFLNNCSDKKTLIFCLSVKHAKLIAKMLQDKGVAASYIEGEMSREERRTILRQYKDGTIQVLCNCQLLTEGFDEPSIQALILARPTKSKVLYCQMIGRGVRPFPGKKYCYVYDLSDEIHNLCSFDVLGTLPAESTFEFLPGETLEQAFDRYALAPDAYDVTYDLKEHALFEMTDDPCSKPAMDHQKKLLLFNRIPFLDDVTIEEAAYLLFKHSLMRKNGIDTRTQWEKWYFLPCSNTA